MKSLFFIAITSIIVNCTIAQSSLVKSLTVGNEWIYYISTSIPPNQYYSYQKVIGDTTIDQKKYSIITAKSSQDSIIYYDYQRTDSTKLYRYVPAGIPPLDNPHPAFEDTLLDINLNIDDHLSGYLVIDKSNVFYYGRNRLKIHMYYEQIGLIHDDVYYLEGVGILYEVYGGHALAGNEITSELKASILEGKIFGDSALLDVKESKNYLPSEFRLYQNYPNPFNPSTTITFSLKGSSIVTLKIYNNLGNEVLTLINRKSFTPGIYEVKANMSSYPSGVYFYRIMNDNFTAVKKMILIK